MCAIVSHVSTYIYQLYMYMYDRSGLHHDTCIHVVYFILTTAQLSGGEIAAIVVCVCIAFLVVMILTVGLIALLFKSRNSKGWG